MFPQSIEGLSDLQWNSLESDGGFIGSIDMHSMCIMLNSSAWIYAIHIVHHYLKFSQMEILILLLADYIEINRNCFIKMAQKSVNKKCD